MDLTQSMYCDMLVFVVNAQQKVKALAKALGATVEVHRSRESGDEVNVSAPPGHVWVSDGTHFLVNAAWDTEEDGGWTPIAKLWAEALERMEYGVEPCTDNDCDICEGA